MWHHIVGTYNSPTNTLSIYIDGVPGTPVTFTTSESSVSALTLGAGPGQDGYFNGTLDDFRIYNRALSASEVKQLYLLAH